MSKTLSRRDVEAVVLGQLRASMRGLGADRIDTGRSMRELGANSIVITEVVAQSIRALDLRVSRAELEPLRNLDGLVDLLYAKARGKE